MNSKWLRTVQSEKLRPIAPDGREHARDQAHNDSSNCVSMAQDIRQAMDSCHLTPPKHLTLYTCWLIILSRNQTLKILDHTQQQPVPQDIFPASSREGPQSKWHLLYIHLTSPFLLTASVSTSL